MELRGWGGKQGKQASSTSLLHGSCIPFFFNPILNYVPRWVSIKILKYEISSHISICIYIFIVPDSGRYHDRECMLLSARDSRYLTRWWMKLKNRSCPLFPRVEMFLLRALRFPLHGSWNLVESNQVGWPVVRHFTFELSFNIYIYI